MGIGRPLVRRCKRELRKSYAQGKLTDEQMKRLHAIGFHPEIPFSYNHPVVCYESGEEFSSVGAVMERFGLSQNSVYRSINNGYSAGGRHFYFKSEGKPEPSFLKPKRERAVICRETDEVFDTITEAANAYGVSNTCIANAIETGCAVRSRFHFQFVRTATGGTEGEQSPHTAKRKYRKNRSVICTETGERFESVNAAAKATGFSKGSFYCVLCNAARTLGGYHWEYVDDGEEETMT